MFRYRDDTAIPSQNTSDHNRAFSYTFSQYQADSNYLTSEFTSRLNEVKEQTKQYSDKMNSCTLQYNVKGSHQQTKKGCWF